MKLATLVCLVVALSGCAHAPATGWDETSLDNMTLASNDAQAYFDAHPDSRLEAIANAGATAFMNADSTDVDALSKLAVATMETVAKEVFGIRDLSAYLRQELRPNRLYSDSELIMGALYASLKNQKGETP